MYVHYVHAWTRTFPVFPGSRVLKMGWDPVFPGSRVLKIGWDPIFPGSRVLKMDCFPIFGIPQAFRLTRGPKWIWFSINLIENRPKSIKIPRFYPRPGGFMVTFYVVIVPDRSGRGHRAGCHQHRSARPADECVLVEKARGPTSDVLVCPAGLWIATQK